MSTERELLSPVDASWFRMEDSRDPADIASVMVFDEPLDDAKLRKVIEERLLVHTRFRRRVVDSPGKIAPPHWEDEPGFTLDAHLTRTRLPSDGDAALAKLVTNAMNEPVDFTRSPWHIWVVDGVGKGSAMVVRVHHCMGDGFALVDVLLSLADAADGSARPVTAIPTHAEEHDAGWLASAAHASRDAKDAMAALGHLLVLPFDAHTRFKHALTGERRIAWSAPVPLARVKEIARARKATVNDVLMTALSGAYRRYLLERGEPAVSFRAIVPVNLRPPGQPIDQEHGNWFGLVFLDLPVEVDGADARLRDLKREMDRIKHSKEAIVALGILAVLGRSPVVVDHIAQEIFARKASVVVTNVPGPREILSVAGSRLRDMWFWAPHPCGLGSGASILSYAGNVRLGVRADAGVVPDPERIAEHFVAELDAWWV